MIARSAAFTKRNVQEALTELSDAGVVTRVRLGNEWRYGIDGPAWGVLLEVEGFPVAVDWVPLLAALTRILAWLRDEAAEGRSEYLQGSAARSLLDEIRPDLEWAGIPVGPPLAAEALGALEAVVDRALAVLGVDR